DATRKSRCRRRYRPAGCVFRWAGHPTGSSRVRSGIQGELGADFGGYGTNWKGSIDQDHALTKKFRLFADMTRKPGVALHPVLPCPFRIAGLPQYVVSPLASAVVVALEILGRNHPELPVEGNVEGGDKLRQQCRAFGDDRSIVRYREEIVDDHLELF